MMDGKYSQNKYQVPNHKMFHSGIISGSENNILRKDKIPWQLKSCCRQALDRIWSGQYPEDEEFLRVV